MVQGIIFAAIQSFGLQGLLILGCEPLSQVMLPGKGDLIKWNRWCLLTSFRVRSFLHCTVHTIHVWTRGSSPSRSPVPSILTTPQMEYPCLSGSYNSWPDCGVRADSICATGQLLLRLSRLLSPQMGTRLLWYHCWNRSHFAHGKCHRILPIISNLRYR